MRFLHISDLHYSKNHATDLRKVVDGFLGHIQEQHAQRKVDLVLFSGDLVYSGTDRSEFDEVRKILIEPLASALGISCAEIVICAGNHDVCQKTFKSQSFVDPGLLAIKSQTDLNKFLDEAKEDTSFLDLSLKPLTNFREFEQRHYGDIGLSPHALLNTRICQIDGRTIGISVFNSAWRSTAGGNDRGRLLIGERVIDLALDQTKAADIRMAVVHHPFDWYDEFDRETIELRLAQNYDFLFCGHIHSAAPSFVSNMAGKLVVSQSGALFQSRANVNTYQIGDVDLSTGLIKFSVFEWADYPQTFVPAIRFLPKTNGCIEFSIGPIGPVGENDHVQAVLNLRRSHIRSVANDHVTIVRAASERVDDIKEVFICPPLSRRRGIQWQQIADGEGTEAQLVTLPDLLRSNRNCAIFGAHDSGKTSLGHLMAVHASEGVLDRPRIPALVPGTTLTRYPRQLRQRVRDYLLSGEDDAAKEQDVDAALGRARDAPRLLIIDDFRIEDDRRLADLRELMRANPMDRWILLCSDEGSTRAKNVTTVLGADFDVLFLQDLPRRHMREISRRRNDLSDDDTARLFPQVMDRLQSSSLPRNGYIVSLLSWIALQDPAKDVINEAVLIRSVVDHLLQRGQFDQALRSKIDAEIKEILLSEVARFLLDAGGEATHNDILQFVLTYLKNKNLLYSADVILTKLIECRILMQAGDRVRFRFSCYQQFFYARYLRDNPSNLNQIISRSDFTPFIRELDLLTSLARTDFGLIRGVMSRLNEIYGTFDQAPDTADYAIRPLGAPITLPSINRIKKDQMSQEQVDDLLDDAETQAAQRRATSGDGEGRKADQPDVATYMDLSMLLGLLVRNAEIADGALKEEALEALLTQHARLIDSAIESVYGRSNQIGAGLRIRGSKIEDDELKVLLSIVHLIIPYGYSSYIRRSLATRKLLGTFINLQKAARWSVGARLLGALVLFGIDTRSGLREVKSIVDDRPAGTTLTILRMTLMTAYKLRDYDPDMKDEIEKVIADIAVKLGEPSGRRGAIISALRTSQIPEREA